MSERTGLPRPLVAGTGWPWEDAGPEPSSPSAPRITVVTPSFNQARFIEKTLRSVLLQHYPNLEYIVVDGGSTDGTVGIIDHYADHLSYWDSRPDRGQADAINRAFRIATGEILCWLNSDDFYFPGTLSLVASGLNKEVGRAAIIGDCLLLHEDGRPPVLLEGMFVSRRRLLEFWNGYCMHQPSIFWTRDVFEDTGFLREDLHYTFDFDYWARIAERHTFHKVHATLAAALYHPGAKTGDGYKRYHAELRRTATSYWGSPLRLEYWRLAASMFYGVVIRSARSQLRLRTRLRRLRSRTWRGARSGQGASWFPAHGNHSEARRRPGRPRGRRGMPAARRTRPPGRD